MCGESFEVSCCSQDSYLVLVQTFLYLPWRDEMMMIIGRLFTTERWLTTLCIKGKTIMISNKCNLPLRWGEILGI